MAIVEIPGTSASATTYLATPIPGTKKLADGELIGIGGFNAYVALRVGRELSSSSPDITVEDGTYINDTIFLKPVTINIEGNVSDVHLQASTVSDIFKPAAQVLGAVSAYLPARTAKQINDIKELSNDAFNALNRVNAKLEQGERLLNLLGDKTGSKGLQEQFIDAMDRLFFSKSLTTLETAYRVYDNVRIDGFKTTVVGTSNQIKFSITAKQLRLKKLEFSEVKGAPNPSKGLGGKTGSKQNKGPTGGKPVVASLASQLLSSVKGL